jgi:hypothetical protein
MIFDNRLAFFDQCIAGDRTQFDLLLSKDIYNTFDRSYELYRDYIRQKNSITDVSCSVGENELVFHMESKKTIEDLISDNMPKKGIIQDQTKTGVDLHIALIDVVTF